MKKYLERKSKESFSSLEFRNFVGINERQSHIIKIAMKHPTTIFISKDLQIELGVSVKTIRSDLEGLVKIGLLKVLPMNKRLMGYIRTDDFESKLAEIRGN